MHSVCLFGSVARNSADSLSDRDVLIVDECGNSVQTVIKEWEAGGWNVTHFTWAAFHRLMEGQPLFFQHLKQEGRILTDEKGHLRSALSSFLPRKEYICDRNNALAQLSILPSAAGSYWEELCLSDLTYVLFRNAGILHYASNKKYLFDYETLTNHFALEFGLAREQILSLRHLRTLKNAYRLRTKGALIQPYLRVAMEAILQISKKLYSPRSGQKSALTQDYFSLRLTEMRLIHKYDPRELDMLSASDPEFRTWNLICNPGGYPKPTGIAEIRLANLVPGTEANFGQLP